MRNKKKLIMWTISIITIISTCTLVIYFTTSNFILSVITPDINLADENFNGIYLNQNINEFNKADVSVDINNLKFYKLSNGVRLITDESGNINNIAIPHNVDQTVKTSRGVTVGDSLENVKRNYGADYYNRHEQGFGIIVYVDNNKFLEFWHWNDEVQEIRVGINGSN